MIKKKVIRKFLPVKNGNYSSICCKNGNFSSICLEKSKFFGNLPGEIEFLPGFTIPQILNQIVSDDGFICFRLLTAITEL